MITRVKFSNDFVENDQTTGGTVKINWKFTGCFIPYFWMNVMSVYSLSNSLVFDEPNLLISKKFLPKFVKILQKKFVFSGDKLTISFHKFWYKSLSMKCMSLSCN